MQNKFNRQSWDAIRALLCPVSNETQGYIVLFRGKSLVALSLFQILNDTRGSCITVDETDCLFWSFDLGEIDFPASNSFCFWSQLDQKQSLTVRLPGAYAFKFLNPHHWCLGLHFWHVGFNCSGHQNSIYILYDGAIAFLSFSPWKFN